MNYQIKEDITFTYNRNEKLFLMLIQSKNNHFVRVDSTHKRLGFKYGRAYKETEAMFSDIEERMRSTTDLQEIEKILELAFTMPTVKEFMFVINIMNTSLEFNSIWKLERKYGCRTAPQITDLIFEDKSLNNTIYIKFPGREEPLGYFRAENPDDKFTFYLYPDF